MKYYKIIFTLLLTFNFLVVVSQEKTPEYVLKARESIDETKYNKIGEKDLEINYNGKTFTFGDTFESVDHKIGSSAIYSGEFNLKLDGVGFYTGIADYMIRYENADFYFENGQFSYFDIWSKEFTAKLRSPEGNNGVISLRVGQSINVIQNLFRKSFDEKGTVGDADNDRFIINVGELRADSPIANDLIIMVEKGTDKISRIAFYGY